MRTSVVFFMGAALAACLVGCGSSTVTEEEGPGAAGATSGGAGVGGTGGVAGTTGAGGVAGASGAGGIAGIGGSDASAGGMGGAGGDDSGVAGAGGGDSGVAGAGGTSGAGGAPGAGGTSGAGGAVVVDKCDGKTPQRPLPYAVGTDFTNPQTIPDVANAAVDTRWIRISNPDCVGALPTGIPAEFPIKPADGGAGDGAAPDGGDDGAVAEAGDDAAVAEAGDDAEVEAGDDAAVAEAGDDDAATADVSVTDAGANDVAVVDATADGPSVIPACWGFYYNADQCTLGAGCWAGVIFEAVVANETAAKAAPGICIAAGATTLEFDARISRPGAPVKFGSTRPGVQVTEQWITTLTAAWQHFSIPVVSDYRSNSSSQYGVFNGFSAVVEPQDNVGGTYLQVKNMTWTGPAGG
jgi:hypothetical protein